MYSECKSLVECYNPAMMTTLEKAMNGMREALPVELQEKIAENLIAYTEKWRTLKSLTDEGVADVEAGRMVEITDIDAYLKRFRAMHAG